MARIQDDILEGFFSELVKTEGFSKQRVEKLRELFNVGKKPKATDFVKVKELRGIRDLTLIGEERLANLVSDRISPRIIPEIEILPWRRTQVLALEVHPRPSRPHHVIREGPVAGVYVRVGSSHRP